MVTIVKYMVYKLILDTMTKYFEDQNDMNIPPERYVPFLNAINDQVIANEPSKDDIYMATFDHGYMASVMVDNEDDTIQLIPFLDKKVGPNRKFCFNLIYTHSVVVGKQIQSQPSMINITFRANALYWNYLAGTDRLEQFMNQIYQTVVTYEKLLTTNGTSKSDVIITVPFFAQDSHSVVL